MGRLGVSVRVLVVLFQHQLSDVWRLVPSIGAAVGTARSKGYIDRAVLAIGDSSPAPVLAPVDVENLASRGASLGLSSLTYQFFGANLGSAGGNNRLAEGADEEFILMLNPDTYPSPTMLSELLRVFKDPSVGAADGRQIPLEHPKDYDQFLGNTSWVSGSCLLVRTGVFRAVGEYDDSHFFLYCDDVDLSWRIRLRGLRVVHIPSAVMFHDKRIRADGSMLPTPSEEFYALLGRLMLARKYGHPEIVEQTLAFVEAEGSEGQRRAAQEWHSRLMHGRVPEPLPGGPEVAEFLDGEYARHRF